MPDAAPRMPAVPSPSKPAGLTLQVRAVGLQAGSVHILHRITFQLFPGELCAVIGPSGAGKSSLIKVLLGLRKPSAGEVRLGSTAVSAAGPVGYVPQEDALHGALTVKDALLYSARLRLPQATEAQHLARVDEVTRQVGLWERRDLKIARLSGGQKKRVSVALELLTSPGLLILDEPTSGLDPGMEAHMMSLFQDVAKGGRVVMVATHAMESLHTCHALLILVEGHVVYFAHPKDAPSYFGAPNHAAIFGALKTQKGAAWAAAWEKASLRLPFASRQGASP